MVARQFLGMLAERGVTFDGTCPSAIRGIVLGVCDYVAGMSSCSERQLQMEPHLEAAVVAVVRHMILDGLKQNPPQREGSLEMIAATASWAIYGAAKEWVRTPGRCSAEEVVEQVMGLVQPVFNAASRIRFISKLAVCAVVLAPNWDRCRIP